MPRQMRDHPEIASALETGYPALYARPRCSCGAPACARDRKSGAYYCYECAEFEARQCILRELSEEEIFETASFVLLD